MELTDSEDVVEPMNSDGVIELTDTEDMDIMGAKDLGVRSSLNANSSKKKARVRPKLLVRLSIQMVLLASDASFPIPFVIICRHATMNVQRKRPSESSPSW